MLELNKLLDDNERRSLGDYSIDIANIVTYIIMYLGDSGLVEAHVSSKALYMNQQPTHIVISIAGLGHGTIELLTLTRDNIDERIESIVVLLQSQLIDRQTALDYNKKLGLERFIY